MMRAPIIRVLIPQLVAQTSSCSPCRFWKVTSKALAKFCPGSGRSRPAGPCRPASGPRWCRCGRRQRTSPVHSSYPAPRGWPRSLQQRCGRRPGFGRSLPRPPGARMGGVTFLPEKLRRPEKEAGPQLPANHVAPLVDEDRQITVGHDPLLVHAPDDGLRRGPDHQALLELLAAAVRHHRAFRREPLYMLGFLVKETLRNEKGEVGVLVAPSP